MSIPEKRELLEELEGLPPACYEEVLDFMQFLKQKKGSGKVNLAALDDDLATVPKQARFSLMNLQGLGKELWQGIDTTDFLEQERNAWG